MFLLSKRSLERSLATEEADIAEIVQGFLALQARSAAGENRRAALGRSLDPFLEILGLEMPLLLGKLAGGRSFYRLGKPLAQRGPDR